MLGSAWIYVPADPVHGTSSDYLSFVDLASVYAKSPYSVQSAYFEYLAWIFAAISVLLVVVCRSANRLAALICIAAGLAALVIFVLALKGPLSLTYRQYPARCRIGRCRIRGADRARCPALAGRVHAERKIGGGGRSFIHRRSSRTHGRFSRWMRCRSPRLHCREGRENRCGDFGLDVILYASGDLRGSPRNSSSMSSSGTAASAAERSPALPCSPHRLQLVPPRPSQR